MIGLKHSSNHDNVTSAELLRRYCARGDQSAFAELVSRHAELVLGVCRRVLRHEQDAEDAFQATFLVLAQNSHRVRRRDSVASWLYAVARRTALRSGERRRRRGEEPLIDDPPADTSDATSVLGIIARRGEQQLLDEELGGLPDKYRLPLLLHCLMGRTCSEVASQLGLSVTAVEGRLKRGKRELRMRLIRRGVCVSATLAALTANRQAACAAAKKLMEAASMAGQTFGADETSGAFTEEAELLARQEVFIMSQSATLTSKLTAALLSVAGAGLLLYGLVAPADGQQGERRDLQTFNVALPNSDSTAAEEPVQIAQADEVPTDFSDPFDGADVKPPKTAKSKPTFRTPQYAARDYKRMSPKIVRIYEALDDESEIEFVDTPLQDVIEFLASLHDIPILIDAKNLDDLAIPVDTPMTLSVKGVSLQAALSLLLSPLDLEPVVEDEVLKITTADVAAQTLDTRVYELRRLPMYEPEELADVVALTVEADSWDEVGGPGTVCPLPGCLVVTQSQKVHRKIGDLLSQLERHADLAEE